MPTFTITSSRNFDSIDFVSRDGNDTYNIGSNAVLTINTDTRYCLNSDAVKGNIRTVNVSGTGGFLIDGRDVRIIPFSGGGGLVPSIGTTISQGGTTASLLGVWSSLGTAPTAPAAAMPASGWIKVKDRTGSFAAGALTGVTATATGADRTGWIEVVGMGGNLSTINMNEGTKITSRGAWFTLPDSPLSGGGDLLTSGLSSTTYQLPASLTNTYWAGVWVESGSGTGIYNFYTASGSATGVYVSPANTIGTDSHRGRVCWISPQGLLQLGSDGTNTNGHTPPAGCRIRVPNIMTLQSALASAINEVPNTTALANRTEIFTSGAVAQGGGIDLDLINLSWYINPANSSGVTLTNMAYLDGAAISRCYGPIVFTNVGTGSVDHTQSFVAYTGTKNMVSTTFTDVVFTRCFNIVNTFMCTIVGCNNLNLTRVTLYMWKPATLAGQNAYSINACQVGTFTDCVSIGGLTGSTIAACKGITFKDFDYTSCAGGTTDMTYTATVIMTVSNDDGFTLDGLTLGNKGTIPMVAPHTSLVSLTTNVNGATVKNIGTPAAPLNLGGADFLDVPYTHVSGAATGTVTTPTPHGLKTGDFILVTVSSDTGVFALTTSRTVTVTGPNTFTTSTATGTGTAGTISFYPVISGLGIQFSSSNATSRNNIVSRVYLQHGRTQVFPFTSLDNDGLDMRNTWGDNHPQTGINTFQASNSISRGGKNRSTLAGQTVPGNHFFDNHFGELTAGGLPVSATWTRSGTVVTVTLPSHMMWTGDSINVTACSDTAALPLGPKATVTVLTSSTFTVTGVNAGATSGTLTFENVASYVAFFVSNPPSEASLARGDLRTVAGNPSYAGIAYTAPNIGDSSVWEHPDFILGHTGFHHFPPVFASYAGALDAQLYEYQINKNDGYGYSGWKNAARAVSGTTVSGLSTMTLTSTAGISPGDWVLSTTSVATVGHNCQVVSVDSPTGLTLSTPNIGSSTLIHSFSALPSEVLDPARGFKMKLRRTSLAAQTAITISTRFHTKSTTASRAIQYPLTGPVYEWPLLSFGIPVGRTFLRPPAPRGFIVPPISITP